MRIIYNIFSGLFVGAMCLAASNVSAHEGIKYDCSGKGKTVHVEFFDDENRVQITYDGDKFAAVSDKKGGFLNVFEEAQFYPHDVESLFYKSSSQFSCKNGIVEDEEGNDQYIGITGKSLGGTLRQGPGVEHKKVGRLPVGEKVEILSNTEIFYNGYKWFLIKVADEEVYQWGGILCSDRQQLNGIREQCKY